MALVQVYSQPLDFAPSEPLLESHVLDKILKEQGSAYRIEKRIPASPLQKQIVKQDSPQWIEANIFVLEKKDLRVEQIENVWRELGSHHMCLRSIIETDSSTGSITNIVLQRASRVRWGVDEMLSESSSPGPGLLNSVDERANELPYIAVKRPRSESNREHYHVLLHIRKALVDTTSLGIIAGNFALLWSGLSIPEHTPFGTYLDFTATAKDATRSSSFWSQTLEGLTAKSLSGVSLQVSTTRSSIYLEFDSSTIAGISRLALAGVIESRRLFEAIWALTLSHHNGDQDVVFATTGRDSSFFGVESCVGLVDQVYPVRLVIDPTKQFVGIVRQLQDFHLEASQHAHLGYSAIQGCFNSGRVESIITYAPGIKSVSLAGSLTCFPISLFITGTSSIRAILCHGSTVTQGRAEMLLRHFSQAVSDAVHKTFLPHTLACNIDISSDEERQLIMRSATENVRAVEPSTIVCLFERAVAKHAPRPAVQFEREKPLTFSQLNLLSNGLARALRPKRGTIVPVCIDRSVELIVALLAILKSGAAYTVLDPDAPVSRSNAIVDACNARGVLVQKKYSNRFECETWCIEDLSLGTHGREADPNLDLDISPSDTAYVIFTSGSTGTPKGVVLSHAAATSGMVCHNTHGLGRWLLFYNPVFSAAQRTMLSTLVHGSTLLLARKEQLTQNLSALLRDLEVEALGITPSALAALQPENIPSVKQIVLVGERIPSELTESWADKVALFNSYGLSECTQINFSRRLRPGSNPRIVGRPIDTTAAFVLKPGTIELAPLGIPGELCLAGPQLATGYLNLPGETDRAFIPNPFGTGRLFRTGDIARTHGDGSIEIIGRLDFQAKIAGQKVDPSEVDQAITQHPAVVQSATAPVDLSSGTGSQSLVAAVVLNPEQGQDWVAVLPSLRTHAATLLPGFMIPPYWMPLDQLPTNANGKVDLRLIQLMARELGAEGLVSRSLGDTDGDDVTETIEVSIAECWAEVLELPSSLIRRDHTFISLGGSSIQALRLISLLHKRGLVADLAQVLDPAATLAESAACYTATDATAVEEPMPFSLVKDQKIAKEFLANSTVIDAYPATPLQESLLASLESDEEDIYTYRRVWDVRHLDTEKLRLSMASVFGASDILQTSFKSTTQGYLQVVHSGWTLPWYESDLHLSAFMEQNKQTRFDLCGPLIRVTLVDYRFLVVTTHHALFDFWSHQFLYHDTAAAYLGQDVSPRPRFNRFIRHLQVFEENRSHEEFWRNYLSNVHSSPLNHGQAAVADAVILARSVDGLAKKIKDAGFTSGSLLYAAWAVLLSQRTACADVVFATAFSGRDVAVPGVDRTDGPTLTVVPQRVTISPEESLRDFAARVTKGLYELIRHSQSGMRKALSLGQLKSSDIDTLVNVLVKNPEPSEFNGIFRRQGERSIWQSARTTVEIELEGDNLRFHFIGKVDQRRGRFLLDAYIGLIQSFVDNSAGTISQLDPMGTEERHFVERELSHRETLSVPQPRLLHARFEEVAEDEPNHIAIDWNAEREISYAELNSRANRVASYLVQQGTEVGEKIPLVLEKSPDMMSIILGIMKAGAAYVPLSPSNPRGRNHFIIQDVQARRVIANKSYVGDLPVDEHLTVHVAETLPGVRESPDVQPVAVQVTPNDLAYVIYTSGSTGTPKGVQVPHRSAAAAVESMTIVEGRYEGEWRTLQFANYVFDASVQDFFNTLSTGGTLCMAPTDDLQSDLPGAINRMKVQQAILTPTVGRLLQPHQVPSMKKMILGGEPLPQDVIEKWIPHTQILNVYGPTETSMVVTTKDVQMGDTPGNIGAPFPTVQVYIVQPNGDELVPFGSVGELCIAGPQVTAGYVGRDDLTAAVFTKNGTIKVDCLYRTGDLARWLSNGDIECLGRKDNQVKIHGYRIELAEVEQAIIKTGLVEDGCAAIVPMNLHQQASCLAAFCVFRSSHSAPSIEDPSAYDEELGKLHAQLSTLAYYMVPKYVFPLNAFPKLPSQKTDRKTLKKWAEDVDKMRLSDFAFGKQNGVHDPKDFVSVKTETEAALEKMWMTIFALAPEERIGRTANFMSLGGDSITAIRLVGLARSLGYSLSVQKVLKSTSLQHMAESMEKLIASERKSPRRRFEISADVLREIEASGLEMNNDVDYIYPCPPGQAEFLSQGDREEQVWQLMAVRHMEAITPQAWLDATIKLTKLNDILRTSWMRDEKGDWVGVVLKATTLDVVYQSDCTTEEQKQDFIDGFWIDRFSFGAPWIKYAVLQSPTDSQSWDLVIKMNHGVYDGTLFRIFDEQWKAIRQQQPLPPYGEFREFVFDNFRSRKRKTLEYWKASMAAKTQTYHESNNSPITNAVARRTIRVGLEDAARDCGVTPAIVFQTAYQLWLARMKGMIDGTISFDYLLSGRNVESATDPQTINGILANFLPLASHLDSDMPLSEYLKNTQDLFWAATENGNVGLDEIYAAAELQRSEYGNKTLFLFQPFEPIQSNITTDEIENTHWLPLSKAKHVHLVQPYEIVVEVAKSTDHYRIALYYDSHFHSAEAVETISGEFTRIVKEISAKYGECRVRDIIEL